MQFGQGNIHGSSKYLYLITNKIYIQAVLNCDEEAIRVVGQAMDISFSTVCMVMKIAFIFELIVFHSIRLWSGIDLRLMVACDVFMINNCNVMLLTSE